MRDRSYGTFGPDPGADFEGPDVITFPMRKIAPLLASLAIACSTSVKETPSPKSYTIAVVPQGATHEFWKSIHAGAIKAQRDLKASGVEVNLIWKAPLREDDREQQVQVVEGFISQGVSGLVLAPLDSRALERPVEEAARAGIPTVIFDSALANPDKAVSYVSTDNGQGGLVFMHNGDNMIRYPDHGEHRQGLVREICLGLMRHTGLLNRF